MNSEVARRSEVPADAPAVRLRGVRKRFGFSEVLRGVDLDVECGECLAVFGPNGAGKSTLIRIIATQWQPSAGEGEVFGFSLRRRVLEVRRRVGVVLHQSFLRAELSLDENLRLFASLYGVADSARVDGLVERFGLEKRRSDLVGAYSQGMLKRGNLIRSLLHAPDLWILDEPFSGLDPEGCDVVVDALRAHRSRGGTALLVTHQTRLGEELATRSIRLLRGRIEGTATTEQVDSAGESS